MHAMSRFLPAVTVASLLAAMVVPYAARSARTR
jgi:hypothetical protein